MNKVLVLNGPNLNLLGLRPAQHYGNMKLEQLESWLEREAHTLSLHLSCHQSNHEGALLDWIHASLKDGTTGLIINAGAYTHTSIALADAIEVLHYPVIEVHLSNIYARESFRHKSMLAAKVTGQISGFGPDSYVLALHALARRLNNNPDQIGHLV